MTKSGPGFSLESSAVTVGLKFRDKKSFTEWCTWLAICEIRQFVVTVRILVFQQILIRASSDEVLLYFVEINDECDVII